VGGNNVGKTNAKPTRRSKTVVLIATVYRQEHPHLTSASSLPVRESSRSMVTEAGETELAKVEKQREYLRVEKLTRL
jgi:hypothetical protein